MKKFVLLIAMLSIIANSFSQKWDMVNPFPNDDSWCGIKFCNDSVGYIIGYEGSVLKTYDGGETWNRLPFFKDVALRVVNFIDENNGYIYGYNILENQSKIYFTNDGGNNFELIASINNPIPTFWINDVYADNQNMLLISTVGEPSKIFKSIDGGNSWNIVLAADSMESIVMCFLNDTTGYALGNYDYESTIYKTVDGGNNWTVIRTLNERLTSICFRDEQHGCVVGDNGFISNTIDGGVTWYNTTSLISSYLTSLTNYHNTYCCLGVDGQIVQSSDDGLTWSKYTTDLVNPSSSILFQMIDSNTFYGIGDGTRLFKSYNGGQNWTYLHTGTRKQIYSASFINAITGYATGNDNLVKTIDAGETWQEVVTPLGHVFKSLHFSTLDNGLAIDSTGKVYETTDGGVTWDSLSIANLSMAESFSFLSSGIGFITGVYSNSGTDTYKIFKTIDGGSTWNLYGTGLNDTIAISNLLFVNSNIGYASYGNAGSIIKTVDGGLNWTIINTNLTTGIKKLFSLNETACYCIGNNNKIFKSIDGGNIWTICNTTLIPGDFVFQDIFFKDTNEGYISTNWGLVFLTNNGGVTWDWQYLYLGYSNLLDIDVYSFEPNDDNLFVYGAYGNIFKLRTLNKIEGYVFNDLNNNNLKDIEEPLLQNIVLKAVSGNVDYESYCTTVSNQKYCVFSDSGNYVLDFFCYCPYYSCIPVSFNGTFSGIGNIDSNINFAFHFLPDVKDLEVYLTNLTPARPGFEAICQITYRNAGTDTMSGNIQFQYDNVLSYVSSTPDINNQNLNILTWDYYNLAPLESKDILVHFNVAASAQLGDTINNSVEVFPTANDSTINNNKDSIGQIIVGSYDPNIKEVSPNNPIKKFNVLNGQYLIYTIHFQNTGTDTVFNVAITDCLSENLLYSSLDVLSASHNCSWSFEPGGLLEFYFPHINLPDSNVNKSGSCGFIKFRIMMNTNLTAADTIFNNADIHFDYNIPIATNMVKSFIYDSASSIHDNTPIETGTLLIYPNPSSGLINIKIPQNFAEAKTLEIFNSIGQLQILKTNIFSVIDISSLPKGMYFIVLTNQENQKINTKFIKD
jgi:uncharacterized repeat protein (TIGR01451 family)